MRSYSIPKIKRRNIGLFLTLACVFYIIWLVKLQKLDKCQDSLFKELVPSDVTFDSYIVKTKDGYHIQLFRLRRLDIINYQKTPIFLQHGMGSSANQFLTNARHLSNALVLVDQGYDVWLGNSRGNYYSRNHDHLDMNLHEEFWEFSFQHMSLDLIAELAFVIENTGHQKLDYIGHSMGATMMIAGLSDPDENIRLALSSYVRDFYALTPVVYLVNSF